MTKQNTATLATIFSDILADLAFMFTEEDAGDASPGSVWLETHIGYRGPAAGDLYFRCPAEFCTRLAANLLGIEPSDDHAESTSHDAVKEFMNVVCGHLVTTLHGTRPVFDLTIPSVNVMTETPDLTRNDGEHVSTMTADGCRIQLEYAAVQMADAGDA